MAEGYWFAPTTEETSFLGQLDINDPVTIITDLRLPDTSPQS